MSAAHFLMKLAALPYGMLFRERRPGLVILGYHRVGGGTSSDIDLPVAEFARQMAYLRRHCRLVSLDDLIAGGVSAAPDATDDAIAVTFDDGSRDLYEQALPVLVHYRIPTTVYLATQYIESQQAFDFGDYARAASRPIPLTWAQVREMVGTGVISVGAHTHTHRDLARLSLQEVRDEVERSYRCIADRTGRPPLHFAYPWGALTPPVRREVGAFFRTAVRGGCGKNPFGALDPLALWRRPIQRSDRAWLFRLKLRSYLDGEELARAVVARVRA
ncbi:MAG: polysaccharide deacetylase family protein [Armatimonadota bacterium]|nr:polysaccharide deacetylase family protein [Armatimonadota bacterium]MDR7549000.1 polysaccharide deacetylase family protein [Armatimonadota bacterium]